MGRRTEKQPIKRQRVSTGSTGSATATSKLDTISAPSLTSDQFKSMTIHDKLECIFLCLQKIKSTNERLIKVERTVRKMNDTTRVDKRRINLLASKSIDAEARQLGNNIWGVPEILGEDSLVEV